MFMVTEECSFRASHRVKMADGSWEPYHEHDWLLKVFVRAPVLDPDGFVVDFLDLQAAMTSAIQPYLGKVFNQVAPFNEVNLIPTAECIAWQLYLAMAPQIDRGDSRLWQVALREAPTSWGLYSIDSVQGFDESVQFPDVERTLTR